MNMYKFLQRAILTGNRNLNMQKSTLKIDSLGKLNCKILTGEYFKHVSIWCTIYCVTFIRRLCYHVDETPSAILSDFS